MFVFTTKLPLVAVEDGMPFPGYWVAPKVVDILPPFQKLLVPLCLGDGILCARHSSRWKPSMTCNLGTSIGLYDISFGYSTGQWPFTVDKDAVHICGLLLFVGFD